MLSALPFRVTTLAEQAGSAAQPARAAGTMCLHSLGELVLDAVDALATQPSRYEGSIGSRSPHRVAVAFDGQIRSFSGVASPG